MRKLEARSFNAADITRLAEHIDRDVTPEGRVLQVILDTGLRVGDVLRLDRARIGRGLESGVLDAITKGGKITQVPIVGTKHVWYTLHEEMRGYKGVAQWVCPDGDGSPKAQAGAYQRVNRRFKALGKKAGVEGRVHLHRLRRSFAVAALRETKGDIVAVQQALGHRSLQATQRYLDEIRVDDVGKLQQVLRKKRRKN